jgi:hypothetical protein
MLRFIWLSAIVVQTPYYYSVEWRLERWYRQGALRVLRLAVHLQHLQALNAQLCWSERGKRRRRGGDREKKRRVKRRRKENY